MVKLVFTNLLKNGGWLDFQGSDFGPRKKHNIHPGSMHKLYLFKIKFDKNHRLRLK